jgi:hypothetical protein
LKKGRQSALLAMTQNAPEPPMGDPAGFPGDSAKIPRQFAINVMPQFWEVPRSPALQFSIIPAMNAMLSREFSPCVYSFFVKKN